MFIRKFSVRFSHVSKLILMLFSIIVTLELKAQPPSEGFSMFNSQRFGISFEYPNSWLISENEGLIDFLNPDDSIDTPEGLVMAGFSLRMFDNSQRHSLETVARLLQEQTTGEFISDSYDSLNKLPLSVDNPQITGALMVDGIQSHAADYKVLVSHGNQVYVFDVNTGFLPQPRPSLENDVYFHVLTNFLESLVFTEPGWDGNSIGLNAQRGTQLTQAQVADRFDYPVGIPDAIGWQVNLDFDHYGFTYKDRIHAGEDWGRWVGSVNHSHGQPVYAIANGEVKYSAFANYPGDVVIIEHTLPNGEIWYSMYGHLSRSVSQNQYVSRGQQIGTILYYVQNGKNQAHLHFEVRNFYQVSDINGSSPPGPGYWNEDNQRPPDRGWVDPSDFIEARRCTAGNSCNLPSDAPTVSTGHFPDVNVNNAFFGYIEALYSMKAVGGYSDGTYRPNENATRAAAAKIIVLSINENVSYIDNQVVCNVYPSHPFYHYIRRLMELGISNCPSNGNWSPEDALTRGGIAKFIVLAHSGEPSYSTCQQPFSDVPCSHTFYKYIRRLKEIFDQKGVGLGYSDGTFRPDLAITRDGIAKLTVVGLGLEEYIPTFYDVLYDNTFYPYVEGIAERNITSGCSSSPSLFCPNDLLTRGGAAKFIIRGLGETPYYSNAGYCPYPDVCQNHTFYHYIRRLQELGITTVPSTSNFQPNQSITRGAMAKFIVRALEVRGITCRYDQSPGFSDVPTNHTFYRDIQCLKELNITSGFNDNTFRPDQYITRAAAAKFVYLAFVQRVQATNQEPNNQTNNTCNSNSPSYIDWYRYVVPMGDVDCFRLSVTTTIASESSAQTNTGYLIVTSYVGLNADLKIEVLSSNGTVIASATSQGQKGGASLFWQPPSTGTYYVRLTNTRSFATEGVYAYVTAKLTPIHKTYLPLVLKN